MAIILTDENFEAEVLNSPIPVLVDLYADWCGPCKAMSPVVEALTKTYEGRVKVGKLNVDDHSKTAAKYSVMSIPTFLLIKDGEVRKKLTGKRDQKELVEIIEEAL